MDRYVRRAELLLILLLLALVGGAVLMLTLGIPALRLPIAVTPYPLLSISIISLSNSAQLWDALHRMPSALILLPVLALLLPTTLMVFRHRLLITAWAAVRLRRWRRAPEPQPEPAGPLLQRLLFRLGSARRAIYWAGVRRIAASNARQQRELLAPEPPAADVPEAVPPLSRDELALAAAAALQERWSAVELRSTLMALTVDEQRVSAEIALHPLDEQALSAFDHALASANPIWRSWWSGSSLELELTGDPGRCEAPPLLAPLIDSGRRGRTIYANLSALPHLVLLGPAAQPMLHAALCSMLYLYSPAELALVVFDRQLRTIYDRAPHALALPGTPHAALAQLARAPQDLPCGGRRTLLVLTDPDGPTIRQLALLCRRLRQLDASLLHLLIVSAAPPPELRELTAQLPWVQTFRKTRITKATLHACSVHLDGRALQLDMAEAATQVAALPRYSGELPPAPQFAPPTLIAPITVEAALPLPAAVEPPAPEAALLPMALLEQMRSALHAAPASLAEVAAAAQIAESAADQSAREAGWRELPGLLSAGQVATLLGRCLALGEVSQTRLRPWIGELGIEKGRRIRAITLVQWLDDAGVLGIGRERGPRPLLARDAETLIAALAAVDPQPARLGQPAAEERAA